MANDDPKESIDKQEETLRLVQKLWRVERRRQIFMIVKYTILAFIMLGGFYFIQPYLGNFTLLAQNLFNIQKTLLQNPEGLQKLFEQLR